MIITQSFIYFYDDCRETALHSTTTWHTVNKHCQIAIIKRNIMLPIDAPQTTN